MSDNPTNKYGDEYLHNQRYYDEDGNCTGFSSVRRTSDGTIIMDSGFGQMETRDDHDHLSVNTKTGEMIYHHGFNREK